MIHGALFAGIGGFEDGAQMAGVETKWSVEIEKYQQKVLKKNYPNTKILSDIQDVSNPGYVDIISCGFPCQDISVAGMGGGASQGQDQDYGVRRVEFIGTLNQNTASLKTAQLSLIQDSKESYSIFPKSGIMLNGNVYQTSNSDSLTGVKGFTLLPTPTKSDHKATFSRMEPLERYLKSGHQIRMMDLLAHKGFLKCQRVQLFEMAMGFLPGHTQLVQ